MNTIIDKNFYKLGFIGIFAGAVAAFVGAGAEIMIVPLLVYLQIIPNYKEAIGTSLAALLLPIGIVSVYFYNKRDCGNNHKCIRWNYALTISLFFMIGSFVSYYSTQLKPDNLKHIFAIIMIFMGIIILVEDLLIL